MPKDTEEYNGHPNWATWNVILWAMNEPGVYLSMKHWRPFDESTAEEFIREIWPEGTLDMQDNGGADNYADVHWDHVAEAFNEG
jgi:hypothetical protein